MLGLTINHGFPDSFPSWSLVWKAKRTMFMNKRCLAAAGETRRPTSIFGPPLLGAGALFWPHQPAAAKLPAGSRYWHWTLAHTDTVACLYLLQQINVCEVRVILHACLGNSLARALCRCSCLPVCVATVWLACFADERLLPVCHPDTSLCDMQ